MNPQGMIYYQSIDRGLENPVGQADVRYFGKVFRIPRNEHGSLRQLEWEPSPDELRHEIETCEGRPIRVLDRGMVERFEVIDQETGDVLVMYRVPYDVSERSA